ncbi:MAG TPA: LPS assembly lipoprotein LptE [Caulobacteraceae bacterium]
MRGSSRLHAVRLFAVVILAASLPGCGFTPLYGVPGVSAGLSRIDVVAPDGRVGFLIRENLDDALGHDKAAQPAWRLQMTVVQTRDARGLQVNDVAERYELGLTVRYTLSSIAGGRVVHSGSVSTAVSYDSADSPYAGIAARQDSQQRAASDAARRIQLDLAAWMAHGSKPDSQS